MPIRGITDNARPVFPYIGRLRKGSAAVRDQNGNVKKIGDDLPYFRFTSERPEVLAAFREAYGDQPALINVVIPFATVEEAFDCWKEKWSAGGLQHRCDGETMALWLDKEGKYQRAPKPCDGGCDEVGRLSVWIPELIYAGFVGLVTLETHGINDLLSIQGSLEAGVALRGHNDAGLKGIRWTLRRVKEKISSPMGNGKRARREKWLVKLEPVADWVRLQLQAAQNAAMMLPAPRRVDEQTGEVFEGPEGLAVVDGEEAAVDEGETFTDDDDGFDSPAHAADDAPLDLTATPIPEAHEESAHRQDALERLQKAVEGKGYSWDIFVSQLDSKRGVKVAGCSLDELNTLIEEVKTMKAAASRAGQ